MIHIISFGYGHGDIPEAHITLDLQQHYRDPHFHPGRDFRNKTANDAEVMDVVMSTAGIPELVHATVSVIRAYQMGPTKLDITVGVGCRGGKHRAPGFANALASQLRTQGEEVTVSHRDIKSVVISHS